MGWPIETPRKKRRWTWRHLVGITLVVGAMANLIACVVLTEGNPESPAGDRYYVSKPGRYYLYTNTYREKEFIEVSRDAWVRTRVHLFSQLVTIPIGIFGAVMISRAEFEQLL